MAEPERPPREGSAPRRRLLIVEDDEDFAESLEGVLRAKGLDLRLVREAALVPDVLETFDPAVALVDIRLGRASGLDLVEMLRLRHPDVLTVVMTAYVAADNAIEALRRGAYDYLTKPFEPGQLFATLDRCFDRVEIERDKHAAEEARRTSEARLRALIDNSLDLIVVVDPATRGVRFVSPSVTALLGYEREPGNSRDFFEFVHPADHEKAGATLARCAAEAGATDMVELRFRHKDGSWRWFEVAARGLQREPAMRGVLLSARDVTERRAMEEHLRQSQRLEAVGQLTGGVAHDFNNLLAVIIGNLDLLQRELREEGDLVQLVEGAMHASERGATLIRRLLAFSRRQTLSPRSLDLNQLVAGALDLLRQAVGPHVQIETDLAGELWPCTADAAQLEAALLNLTINARDAMPGGGRVKITTRNVHGDGDQEVPSEQGQPYVSVSVADTGVGIPAEIRDRVFEPFFSTKAPGKGTGLGLSMVFGFVKQSNGQIRFASNEGHGTTFTLYFPHTGLAPSAAATQSSGEVPRARSGESILLVEDDLEVRRILLNLLEELGYQVVSCENGNDALARLRNGLRPNLLLSDVVLPEGPNGFELAATARTLQPELRLLFTSGFAQDLVSQRPATVAHAPLVNKPFHRGELAHHVRRVLDSPA